MATEDDSDIPETGAVFTFGKSKFAENLPSKFWVKNDKVLHVACGDEHTAVVNETGRVFTFGANDWGQLGLDHTKPTNKPTCVKKLKHEKSVLVACGRVHTVVATESGKLYSFGANSEGQLGIDDCSSSHEPKEITGISTHKYKQVSAGADHSAALTEDGEVYMWGGGSEGQLGLGDETECPQPQLLDIEGKVTSLSCGYYHTAIVTEAGELFTFGESDGGKLGLGDEDLKAFTPTKVELPEKATSVACGNAHTVVLLESGKVFSFGDGNNGQLGHGTRILQTSSPKQIYCKYKIKKIACGDSHTALITEKDHLLTFGDGRHGKLGQGQESYCNIYVPTLIERFNNFHVDQVSCGGCHMLAIGHKRTQTEIEESSEEETEEPPEVTNKNLLNASLKADGSLDLNNSFTAREKRRQNTLSKSPSIIKRHLPELNNNKPHALSATLPPNETPLAKERIHGVQSGKVELHRTVAAEKASISSEDEKDDSKHKEKTEVKKEEKTESEDESEEEEEKPVTTKPSEAAIAKAKTSEDEVSEEDSKPVPVKRSLPKPQDHSAESEEEEEAHTSNAARSLPTMPVPPPRKAKNEKKEEDSEEEHQEEKNKKGQKKQKKSKTKIFGKSTGLSDEDEEEEEEVSEEEEVEKEKSEEEDKKGKSKKDKKGKDKEDKKKGKEKEDKKSKTDKKKDKKDKNKKKGKKGDKDEEEVEDEDDDDDKEQSESEEKASKDKKDKKKDKNKKKDKKKEKDEGEEDEEEESDKKGKKKKEKKDKKKEKKGDKDDKDEKEEDVKDEDEQQDKTNNDKKTDEGSKPATQKKSGLCTIL